MGLPSVDWRSEGESEADLTTTQEATGRWEAEPEGRANV